MDTRSSPEGPGEKERPRWIEGPTAASSQPEAQPQMAHLHNNGDGPGTQSTADAESDNFPCNGSKGEPPPSVERAPTVSGIVHHCGRICLRPTFPEPSGPAQRSGSFIDAAVLIELVQGPSDIPHKAQLSLPLDSIRLAPVARSQAATGGQRRKNTTLQAIDKEDRERVKRSGNHTPGIGMVRVVSNPGSDAEDRLRRVFSLMVKHATKDTQDTLKKDCPGHFQPHVTYGKIA